jgi:hypothetical protein
MIRHLAVMLIVACGGSQSSTNTTTESPAADQSPFDVKNTKLRDELGPLIAPDKVVAEYSGLKGSFHHRIRVPYKDITEGRALTMGDDWQVELRVKSERDKERIEPIYIHHLQQAQAERAVEILLELRDHHTAQ